MSSEKQFSEHPPEHSGVICDSLMWYVPQEKTKMNTPKITPQGNAVDPSTENDLQNCNSPNQEFILKMKISEEEALIKCRNVLKKMKIAITR